MRSDMELFGRSQSKMAKSQVYDFLVFFSFTRISELQQKQSPGRFLSRNCY